MTTKQPGKIDFICAEIAHERWMQDEKWGEQNHPDGTGLSVVDLQLSILMRDKCEDAAGDGSITWADILREEAYEAFAEEPADRLRAELIQVAAVCVAWIEAIDRRVQKARDDDHINKGYL